MTQASRRRIFLCWAVLVGLSASSQPLNDSLTIPGGDNWFDHPDILCAALKPLGYQARTWGPIGDSPVHDCVYPPVVRSSDTPAEIDRILATARPPSPLNLDFEVSGLSPKQADTIRIAVTSPTPKAKAAAKEQMLKCIDSLYGVIGQKVPIALPLFVRREQHYLSHQRYGTVAFLITSKLQVQILWFYLRKNH